MGIRDWESICEAAIFYPVAVPQSPVTIVLEELRFKPRATVNYQIASGKLPKVK